MLPMSWVTRSAFSMPRRSSTRATSPAWVCLSWPPSGGEGDAHAAQVWDDDRVVLCKLRRQGRPHISSVGKAMQHDDGWPRATETHMDGCAGLDVLGAEVR